MKPTRNDTPADLRKFVEPPHALVFTFRLRAGAEAPETMQAAMQIETDLAMLNTRLFMGTDARAIDLIRIMESYELLVYSGSLLRFGAALMHIPLAGIHTLEASPLVAPAGIGLQFQAGETMRAVIHRRDAAFKLSGRADGGAGINLQVAFHTRPGRQL